jgi:4-hydroxybenzoate polyprenyltransferase
MTFVLASIGSYLSSTCQHIGAAVDCRFPTLWPLIQLARLHKPIGIYLILWPTLWALWLAAEGFPGWHLFLVFVVGTVVVRSAGCIINDVLDRNFDGKVKRTQNRPLVLGQVSVTAALSFMVILLFVALLLVLTTNLLTVLLALGAVITAAIYPLMKRFTYMPQAILGLAFSFGTLMSFSAVSNEIPKVAGLLVIANILWTIAYDTQYAMVDRDDDLRLGLKSSAILFADMDRAAIGSLQIIFLLIMYNVGQTLDLRFFYLIGLVAAAGLFIYQQYLIIERDRDGCFNAFLNNHWVGLLIFVGIVLHHW